MEFLFYSQLPVWILCFLLAALVQVMLMIHKKIEQPHIICDRNWEAKEEVDELTEEEINDMLETGVYRPIAEDLAAYYNERTIEDVLARRSPYDDKELKELINGQ